MLEGKNCLQKDAGNRTQQSTKGLISNRLVEEMRTEQRLRGQEKSHVYFGEELLVREISMQTTMWKDNVKFRGTKGDCVTGVKRQKEGWTQEMEKQITDYCTTLAVSNMGAWGRGGICSHLCFKRISSAAVWKIDWDGDLGGNVRLGTGRRGGSCCCPGENW